MDAHPVEFARRCGECGWSAPCVDGCPALTPCGDPNCPGCLRHSGGLACVSCLTVGDCTDDCPEQNQ